jgi:AraC-like DNA-binding protein
MAIASHAPTEVRTDRPHDFRANMRVTRLDAVTLSSFDCLSLESERTQKHIRRSDPELYYLSVVLRGRIAADHAGRSVALGPGGMVLTTTSAPLHGRVRAGERPFAMVDTVFPRTLLPLPRRAADRLTGAALPAADGIGALLADYLTRIGSGAVPLRTGQAARLANVTLDFAAALLAQCLDLPAPPEAADEALHHRVRAFVRRHLGDPDLTPARIAAAHHVSVRTLHRLFQRRGTSVAAYVRHQRLEGARRDLADPALAGTPVHEIAAKWGFPRAADFTRAFRTAYGLPPREYRHRDPAPD